MGVGTVFDMSWALHSTVISTSGGRRLKFFDDVDVVSRQQLPPRYIKLLIFLMRDDNQAFDDIDTIPVTEVTVACDW